MVGEDGEELDSMDFTPMSPRKVPKLSPSNGLKKGPAPKPYMAVKPCMQRRKAAVIVENNDPDAIYHAAYSTATRDMRYVMRRMKEDPNLASEIKEWHKKYLKNKGKIIYLSTIFDEMFKLVNTSEFAIFYLRTISALM